jgi:hypothetical protein
MDSTTHTLLAVGLLAVAFYIGKYFGKQGAIENVLSYLITYGACTEKDIEKANDRFEREQNGE